MIVKGSLDISGSANFNKYNIFQTNLGFNNSTHIINFGQLGTQIIHLTGILGTSITLSGSGYQPNREVKAFFITTGAINQVTYPSGWKWINNKITGFGNNLGGVLTLVSTGFDNNGCYASYGAQI